MAEPSKQDLATYRRLFGYLHGKGWFFLISIVGYVFAAYSEVVFAQTLGAIVDVFDPTATDPTAMSGGDLLPSIPLLVLQLEWSNWLIFPLLICAAALVRAIGSIVGEYLLAHVSLNLIHRVRCDLFDRLLLLPMSYFDRNSLGTISNRLTDTAQKLRDTATEVLRILMQDGFKLIVLICVLIDLSGRLTLLFFLALPIVWVIVRIASKRFRTTSENIQSSMGEVTQVGQEAVGAHKLIRSFGGQRRERGRFHNASDVNRRQNVKMVATKAISSQLIQTIVAIVLGILMGLLFLPQVSVGMTTGDLVTYIAIAGVLVQPVKRLSDLNARIQSGLAAADEIFAHIDQEAEPDDGSIEASKFGGEIEFRNVSFRYESSDVDAVSDISFYVKPGQTVAIVGSSGSGKTTLVELLMGFYRQNEGEILIDGTSIHDFTKSTLRAQLALVSQDIFLFNDTLRANIAYGELNQISVEEMQQALDQSRVTRFLHELPYGLDTIVGDRGTKLSRGQRQRIAIARALLKNAPILILDEATSALDTESEALVQSALNEAMRDRTTIIVAHRLTTVMHADHILVVEHGHVTERGEHHELLRKQGRYAELFEQTNSDSKSDSVIEPPRARNELAFPQESNGHSLVSSWYDDATWIKSLRPLSWLFGKAVKSRRRRASTQTWVPPVPLVVVGNVTVGGTGKTPLVIWLANWLQQAGCRVGIVSRGYKGKGVFPAFVQTDSDVVHVGDEAPLIVDRTHCAVVVDPNRVRAVQYLLEQQEVDVILSDDGLQHYKLGRHIEIAVIDGARGLGNGLLLPAGPLRESPSRLNEVDWVVSNGQNQHGIRCVDDVFFVEPTRFVNVHTQEEIKVEEFLDRVGSVVHSYAAIGNPTRFRDSLRELGFNPISHDLPDHSLFRESDIQHHVDDVIVVTEKDWRKVQPLRFQSQNMWYLEVNVRFEQDVEPRLRKYLASKGIALAA